jgi:activator of HSP90 ATPase
MGDGVRRRDIPALLAGVTLAAHAARAAEPHQDEGLTATAEAIHQDIDFAASRARVYALMLDTKAFDAVIRLGRAARSGQLPNMPTVIAAEEGGAFLLFGGYIRGRHIELVPDTRIVQAWREESWPKGAFSLVRFAFVDAGVGCRIVLDQSGFPQGAGHGLSSGWYADYWDPMRRYLG